MKLPNSAQAIIERQKITHYLLNSAHPDNAGKANFFGRHGFVTDRWQELADALRDLSRTGQVTSSMESEHGRKYVVDGRIRTPSEKSPWVRSVWIVNRGSQRPRLVTAYPLDK